MHKENELNFEEKVALDNEMKEERKKNRINGRLDHLEERIGKKTKDWKKFSDIIKSTNHTFYEI